MATLVVCLPQFGSAYLTSAEVLVHVNAQVSVGEYSADGMAEVDIDFHL